MFSNEEIMNVVKTLKNNKTCGIDNVINEYIKCTIHVFVKLFNIILKSGIIPNNWVLGLIKQLYKNKGSRSDPDNYRGITILSCFGKLFTAVINKRLETFFTE